MVVSELRARARHQTCFFFLLLLISGNARECCDKVILALQSSTRRSGQTPPATAGGGSDKGLWGDLDKQGSGLKQKLRDMKRQVDVEVL